MPKPDPPEVLIFEKNGRYHVEPATVRCKAAIGKVKFQNFTGKRARVWMPVRGDRVEDVTNGGVLDIPTATPPGVYEYAVSIEADEDAPDGKTKAKGASWLAEGNSAPRMVYD